MAKFNVVPSPETPFVRLARMKTGRCYRKEILKKGQFVHPKDKTKQLVVDDKVFEDILKNFEDGVCDIVQFPLVTDDNAHSESPDRNMGEVIGLEVEGDRMFALIDVRREDMKEAPGKTLLGASAMYEEDHLDVRSGEKVGATLLHVAGTNRPYLAGLDGYREEAEAVEHQ